MSKKANYMINSNINAIDNKHLCYLNGVLIGSFNTWHGANNYLVIQVNKYIQNKINKEQSIIKRHNLKHHDIHYPRKQDDEATKAILDYYRTLKD